VNYRKTLIRVVTFLGGVYYFFEWVLPAKIGNVQIDTYHDQISTGFIAIGVMAVGLGLINLLMVHGSKIAFQKSGSVNSLALLLGLFLMIVITAVDWRANLNITGKTSKLSNLSAFIERIETDLDEGRTDVPLLEFRLRRLGEALLVEVSSLESELDLAETDRIPAADPDRSIVDRAQRQLDELLVRVKSEAEGLSTGATASIPPGLKSSVSDSAVAYGEVLSAVYKYTSTRKVYDVFYLGLFVSLGSAMFSLLGFYIASAAYRAFRITSVESALMIAAAILVMLGQIPFGLWISDDLPGIRNFILSVPNTAAFRAIKIGSAIAGLVMAFRMWFSIESEYVQDER